MVTFEPIQMVLNEDRRRGRQHMMLHKAMLIIVKDQRVMTEEAVVANLHPLMGRDG